MAMNMYSGDPETMGQVPSFVYPHSTLFGPNTAASVAVGDPTRGVPPNDTISGDASSSTDSAVAYGQSKATATAVHQPLFWSFVLMGIGVIILGHAAHVNVRS